MLQETHFTEELLEDKHWRNVQDPIKHMFLSLSKAIRIQSSGIRDLDKKCSDFVTIDTFKRYLKESLDQTCSKQDATQLIYQLESKVSEKEFLSLENKFHQLSHQMERLTQQFTQQQTQLEELTHQNQQLTKEITILQNPNYEPIFQYLQKHLINYSQEIEGKLQLKSDKNEIEILFPKKLEDFYVNVMTKFQDFKGDIQQKVVNKDYLVNLLQTKVDRKEFQELSYSTKDHLSQTDISSMINHQIKPLIVGISSIDKTIHIQENLQKEYQSQINSQLHSLQKTQQEILNSGILTFLQPSSSSSASFPFQLPHFQQQLTQKIEDILQEKQIKLLQSSSSSVDSLLQQNNEYLFKQFSMLQEGLRLEMTTLQREEQEIYKLSITTKVQEQSQQIQELGDKTLKIKKNLKELSLNIAKSLSKKLDIKDFKTILKHRVNELSVGVNHPSSSEGIVQTSRHLLHSTGKKSGGGDGSSSDPNREFDFLIQSLKKKRDGRGGHDREEEDQRFSSEERDDSLEEIIHQGRSSRSGSGPGSPSPLIGRRSQSGSPSRSIMATGKKSTHFANNINRSSSKSRDRSDPSARILKSSGRDLPLSNHKEEPSTMSSNNLTIVVLKNEIQQIKEAVAKLNDSVGELQASNKYFPNGPSSGGIPVIKQSSRSDSSLPAEIEKLDWRIALGEVSTNLRREISDKASREELYSLVRTENNLVESRLGKLEKDSEKYAATQQITKLENDLQSLRSKVSSELTGARFLWTTGQLIDDGWIAWDTQIVNVAPTAIVWKKNTTNITIRVPGLYRICLAVFTLESTIVQIYLNNEPIFSLQPENTQTIHTAANNQPPLPPSHFAAANSALLSEQKKETNYLLQRFKHSLGEVSCLHVDEYISLPPECTLSVRYYSSQLSQGLFSINKI